MNGEIEGVLLQAKETESTIEDVVEYHLEGGREEGGVESSRR